VVIRELSESECLAALGRTRVARLGCAADGQPYVVPIFFALDRSPENGPCLYGFTTLGQKVRWMRANPRVCVEWDEVEEYDQWVSVIVFGRYEELPDAAAEAQTRAPERATPQPDDWQPGRDRRRAQELLQTHVSWWQVGYAAFAARDEAESFKAVYYRIRIDKVTGYRASPDPADGHVS
jgi:nitroimidazol reductase NimA-like FMN-containing flavoprotein (pyridoxamine 5'-phosphate oxidase superfamily)